MNPYRNSIKFNLERSSFPHEGRRSDAYQFLIEEFTQHKFENETGMNDLSDSITLTKYDLHIYLPNHFKCDTSNDQFNVFTVCSYNTGEDLFYTTNLNKLLRKLNRIIGAKNASLDFEIERINNEAKAKIETIQSEAENMISNLVKSQLK